MKKEPLESNYDRLYEALRIFRNAMLPFLVGKLIKNHGKKGWWVAIEKALGKEVADSLKKQYEQRQKITLTAVKRTGTELCEVLDINRFLPIVEGNWKLFADTFRQKDTISVWLREINSVRNAVAHPETRDLSDEDTDRALDTMQRVLGVVSPEAANEVSRYRSPPREPRTRPPWTLADGPFNYHKAIHKLEKKIASDEGLNSENNLKLQSLQRQLSHVLNEQRLTPGAVDSQNEVRKEKILTELDRMALEYLEESLADLCEVKGFQESVERGVPEIGKLRGEIEKLESELFNKQTKQRLQTQSGAQVKILDREIQRQEELIAERKADLEHLQSESAPAAYFEVTRRIEPEGREAFVEEQPIRIEVLVANRGAQTCHVSYQDLLPDGLQLVEGATSFERIVGPGRAEKLTYTCCGIRPDKYTLAGSIEYLGRDASWDTLTASKIEIIKGTEPRLKVRRYYEYRPGGLRLSIHFLNTGDKKARSVRYRENLTVKGVETTLECSFSDDIPAGLPGKSCEVVVPVSDPKAVAFEDNVKASYRDSKGMRRTVSMQPGWSQMEYRFPRKPTDLQLVGRASEKKILAELLDQLRAMTRGEQNGAKRVLLMEGIEGSGKTRLICELAEMARRRSLRVIEVDARDSSPFRRMVLQLLDLPSDEADGRRIWNQLRAVLPGEDHQWQRDILQGFVSGALEMSDSKEIDQLPSIVLLLIKRLARRSGLALVLENIQWVAGGVETLLLRKLIEDSLSPRGAPVLVCATRRPSKLGPDLDDLAKARDRIENLQLESLSRQATRGLVDQIVEYPRLSESLYEEVWQWSKGSPFYVVELLRYLCQPDQEKLVRVGPEWQLNIGALSQDLALERLDEIILARLEQELSEQAELAKVLSAAGVSFSRKLAESLAAAEFPEWSPATLHQHLLTLESGGFLTVSEASRDGDGYEFEHQIKHAALHRSLHPNRRRQLHQRTAQILLQPEFASESDEYVRRLGEHLLHSSQQFRIQHLNHVRNAARLERRLRNFTRSLQFYDAAIDGSVDLEKVDLLVERSRIHQMRGNWLPVVENLDQAYDILKPHFMLRRPGREVRGRVILVEKEKGSALLHQPQASGNEALRLLDHARRGLEGPVSFRRWFPPSDSNFFRDLVEVYLVLAELWRRQKKTKICKKLCQRAERLAQTARRKTGDGSLLSKVYLTIGQLHRQQSDGPEGLRMARECFFRAQKHSDSDPYQKERIWLALADNSRRLKDLEEAKEFYGKAITLQKKMGDVQGLGLSYGGLGDFHLEKGRREEALDFFREAHRYQSLCCDTENLWRTNLALSGILMDLKRPSDAEGYWKEARVYLFGQEGYYDLKDSKRREIVHRLLQFARHYKKGENWDCLHQCIDDLEFVPEGCDLEEIGALFVAMGEAALKVSRWEEALKQFGEALKRLRSPLRQAEVHELMGDAYSATHAQPSSRFGPFDEDAVDEAEDHYEKAVIGFSLEGQYERAVRVYEKLVKRILTDEGGLQLFPFTFLRILRNLPLSAQVFDYFIDSAVQILLDNERPIDAADIVVYAAREIAQAEPGEVPLERKTSYLDKAERLYREGDAADLIWGLYMLIPTFLRLGLWPQLVERIEELVELSLRINDKEEFLQALKEVTLLSDKIEDDAHLRKFIDLALETHDRVKFSEKQIIDLYVYVAKLFSTVAARHEGAEARSLEDQALRFYQRAGETVAEYSSIRSMILNDVSVIQERRGDIQSAMDNLNRSIEIKEQHLGYGSAAISRLNRAVIFMELGRYSDAKADLERALEHQTEEVEIWERRLEEQDKSPLSPNEISLMYWDKGALADICMTFSRVLASTNDPGGARRLALRAEALFQDLSKEKLASKARFEARLLEFADKRKSGESVEDLVAELAEMFEAAAPPDDDSQSGD